MQSAYHVSRTEPLCILSGCRAPGALEAWQPVRGQQPQRSGTCGDSHRRLFRLFFPPVIILLLGLSVEITNFIVMYSYLMTDIKVDNFPHLDEYMFEN